MKFDVSKWSELSPNVLYEGQVGRLVGNCSQLAAWYVLWNGQEILAHVGHSVDISISEPFSWRCEVDTSARVFVSAPRAVHHNVVGEVFTNIDRKPRESGMVAEVSAALRRFKLEQRDLRADIRRERFELERERKALRPVVPPVVSDSVPDVVPDVVPDAESSEKV